MSYKNESGKRILEKHEIPAEIEKTESTIELLSSLAGQNPDKASRIEKNISRLSHYIEGLQIILRFEAQYS